MNVKDNLIKNISELPFDIQNIIKDYLPKMCLVFTNRENYMLYHPLIKKSILNYENYIRDAVRRDHEFVFNRIFLENINRWLNIKKYNYKSMVFNNYLHFIIYYCIENDSNNCRKIIDDYLKEHGLCKNLHKKNVIKYIRWKN
jgi:hypothetical protein